MMAFVKQIFDPNNKDIKSRIIFTLLVLIFFKVGATVSIPGTNAIAGNLGFLELLNVMSGGAMQRFSIFALGVMPYINASIIMQLLQMDIIPYFTELRKQGDAGKQKISKITRYLGIFLAFVQGYAFSFIFIGAEGTAFDYLRIAIILTAGTALLLWLGDQISQKGVGNGVSLIIMAGILATTPNMFIQAFTTLVGTGSISSLFVGIVSFTLFVILYLAIIVGVVFVQRAERRIPIQYANQTSSAYGGKQTFLPFRLNSAGVIPVIFASALLMVPTTLAQMLNNNAFELFVNKYIVYTTPTGLALYMLLVLFFAYFYTFVQIKPEELADNLNKNGGYIPGIRPGSDTSKYVNMVLSRITIVGAVFLMIIAGLPIIFTAISKMPTVVTVGGTGLLIVVGVALDSFKQIESKLVSRSYGRRKR